MLALRQQQSQGLLHPGHLQAQGPAGQAGAWPVGRLLWQQGQVHETAVHALAHHRVLQSIKHLVADKGARRLRDRSRESGRLQTRHQRLDGQGAEVGRRSPRDHRLIDRLRPGVVGNARIHHIDGHALHRKVNPPFGLTQRQHDVGCVLRQRLLQSGQRLCKHTRQLHRRDLRTLQRQAVQGTRHLPGWVEALTAKGLEAGEQDAHHRCACQALKIDTVLVLR